MVIISLAVNTILKSDLESYDPIELLDYDYDLNLFLPNKELSNEDFERVKVMITCLGLNNAFVKMNRENYYNELNNHVLNAFHLIINCTPIGMFPNVEDCVDIPYEHITHSHLLFDLIYNPEESLFLKNGKLKGAITVNGLNMLKLQADKAWQIWNN